MRDIQASRVYAVIAPHVIAFARCQRRFHMIELVRYVRRRERKIAPDSPSRILRALRQKHLVDYVVLDRGASLYRIKKVRA